MYDIIFKNIGYAMIADVRHGQARLKGKLDSGSPISVFNTSALSVFTGSDESDLKKAILNSGTPMSEFKGYNGITSNIYLCLMHNIVVGNHAFEKYYAGVSLDYPIGRDGKPITKILLGMDIINSCNGKLNEAGIEMCVVDERQQHIRHFEAFESSENSAVFHIDYIDPFYSSGNMSEL